MKARRSVPISPKRSTRLESGERLEESPKARRPQPDESAKSVAAAFAIASGWGGVKGQDTEMEHSGAPRIKETKRQEQLRALFRRFDVDKSGGLSRKELSVVLKRIGKVTERDIDRIMEAADTNGNGIIEMDEFVSLLYSGRAAPQARTLLEYGDSLRILFKAFDRNGNGLITLREFSQCHGILSGALRLNTDLREDHAHRSDPLRLQKDVDKLFEMVDKDGDLMLSASEFATFLQGMVEDSGITPEHLLECCTKLSECLEGVFRGIHMAQTGEIKEEEPEILEALVRDLASAAMQLDHEIRANEDVVCAIRQRDVWEDPPEGMNVQALKMAHMKHHPLNLRLVESFQFEVVCIQVQNILKTSWRWWAEVTRLVTYRSSSTRKERPSYYEYDEVNNEWVFFDDNNPACDPKSPAGRFLEALRDLAPEIGIFALLNKEADFGKEVNYLGMLAALEQGIDIGWITRSDQTRVEEFFLDKVVTELQAKAAEGSLLEEREYRARAQAFLASSFVTRPPVIMATLTKLAIVKPNRRWKGFVEAA